MAEGSVPQRDRSSALLRADGTYASTTAPRSFLLTDPPIGMPTQARAATPFVAILLLVVSLVLAAVLRGAILRTMLPIALAVMSVSLLFRSRLARARAVASDLPRRAIELDGQGFVLVWRREIEASPASSRRHSSSHPRPRSFAARSVAARAEEGSAAARDSLRGRTFAIERQHLADIGSRFGLTLLSNRKRDRLVAAVTSPSGCFLVGSRLSTAERKTHAAFLARATVISSDEVALDAIGPDGKPVELACVDFRVLVDTLESVDPSCSGRVLLSDPTGAPLLLDGEHLEVRGHHFDLSRPLEWRSFLFQEPFGQALTLYQGTYIRQGLDEVVLVSLLSPSVLDPSPLDFESAGLPELDLAAMRDQRLMQASAGEPPPLEQRVAVDGLFMLPFRIALDQAPRSSQQPVEIRHA